MIKLINYNRMISKNGMSKVLIDEVKVVKSEDGDGSEVLEVLFGNETGTIRRSYKLKTDIEYIVSLVKACGFEIPDDFDFDPNLLLGKVIYIQVDTEDECEAVIYGFAKFNKEGTDGMKLLDKVLNNNPFEDDDCPF